MRVFNLINGDVVNNCIEHIKTLPVDGTLQVEIKHLARAKTLAQLGGLFGAWIKYLSNKLGESEDYLHRMLKAKFLARIYVTDPQGPDQEQWVELLCIYQTNGETEKLNRHAKRISLSWATIDQMREYMNAIEHHYMANGMPLPILDKFRKCYEKPKKSC